MDIVNNQYLAQSGHTLNVEERTNLENILAKQVVEGVKYPQFWGKIYGETGDYLITQSLETAAFASVPTKRFFYCSTADYELKPLPPVSGLKATKCGEAVGRFSGDSTTVVAEYDSPTAEGETEELIEEERLSHTVSTIDNATGVVPLGAYIVEPRHSVIRNSHFEGLSAEEAGNLSSYFHFRPAVTSSAKAASKKRVS